MYKVGDRIVDTILVRKGPGHEIRMTVTSVTASGVILAAPDNTVLVPVCDYTMPPGYAEKYVMLEDDYLMSTLYWLQNR